MGSSERRERERRELRQKILDATRELVAARGYEAVTMREIAKRIEYSATALYTHFEDKETLVRELCRQDFSNFASRLLDSAFTSADPVERLCRAGLVYLSFAQEYPQHYRLMFMMELPEQPPTETERNDPAFNAYVFLRTLVDDLARAGELRPEWSDVELVAQTIWGAVHGAAGLDLMVSRAGHWLDFKPRAERFEAALELILWAVARDPHASLRKLRRVIAECALTSAANRAPARAAAGGQKRAPQRPQKRPRARKRGG